MRFEIKAGGAILILVGLLGLSVIVFAAGIYAGYVIAQNTAPQVQPASVYPLPNPPPAAEAAAAPSKPSDEAESKPRPVVKAATNVKPVASSAPPSSTA